jgi:hypothetical protein
VFRFFWGELWVTDWKRAVKEREVTPDIRSRSREWS